MTRDAAMRPPGRRYSFSDHGRSEQGALHGNHLLKAGAANLWKPSFNGGPTTIRIFPARSYENPTQWDPYRFGPRPGEFGDWIRRYPAVRAAGDPPVTFITQDPTDTSVDAQMTPGWLLYRSIDRAIAAKQEQPGWASLMKGSNGRGAQLPRPSEVYLVQCAIMQYKGKIHQTPRGGGVDDGLVVMELGPSAGKAMIALFDEVNPAWQGDPMDFNNAMTYGDPISINHGAYITFYNLEGGDPRQAREQYGQQQGRSAADAFGARAQQSFQRSGGMEEKGFGCFIERDFRGFSADLTPVESLISSKVKPWDEILNFPDATTQAALLADKFPPEMIVYAWQSMPEWIPPSVHHALANRRSVGQQPGPLFGGGAPAPGGFGGMAAPGGFGGMAAPGPLVGSQQDYAPLHSGTQVPGNQPAPLGQPGSHAGYQPGYQPGFGGQLAPGQVAPAAQGQPYAAPGGHGMAPAGQSSAGLSGPSDPSYAAPGGQVAATPPAGWGGGFHNSAAPQQGAGIIPPAVQDAAAPQGGIPAGQPGQPGQSMAAPQQGQVPMQGYAPPQGQVPLQGQMPLAGFGGVQGQQPPQQGQPGQPGQPNEQTRAQSALARARANAGR